MKTYCIYQHINKTNGKRYIGITKQTPENRWGNDGINYKGFCRFWSAICKYGWDGFEHEIVVSGLTKEEACELEVKLIKEYKTQDRDFGYNILEGGNTPKMTEEVRKKMSSSMKGNKNGLGHPCSEDKKRRISESQKGRKLTPEHKMLLSLAKKREKTCFTIRRDKKKNFRISR